MYIIRLPRLGQTMESGIINTWHLAEGERFQAGDPLYEVETEKMNTEVEAKQDGVLTRIVTDLGEDVPVNTVLGVAAEVGEELDDNQIDAVLGREEAPVDENHDESEVGAPKPDVRSPSTAAGLWCLWLVRGCAHGSGHSVIMSV